MVISGDEYYNEDIWMCVYRISRGLHHYLIRCVCFSTRHPVHAKWTDFPDFFPDFDGEGCFMSVNSDTFGA
ncbi:MAG: hypothetical protein RBG13Loki_3044 [Promethearchaeota archaeon CR_4]|nr:MAG: hypothetical protein RBG13Loki_3044 [Candidatus Lokiarchaeota archaeon CR_4]